MGNSKLLISAAAVIAFGIATPSFANGGDDVSIKDSFNKSVSADRTTNVTDSYNKVSADKTLNVTDSHDKNISADKTTTDSFNKSVSNSKSVSNTSSVRNDLDVDVRLSSNSERNGNVKIVADQTLGQSISNASKMNFDGHKSDYSSGSNSVRGSAFAAYSGILNQGWNTGISSNTQAATNIAAQGQTTFSNR